MTRLRELQGKDARTWRPVLVTAQSPDFYRRQSTRDEKQLAAAAAAPAACLIEWVWA